MRINHNIMAINAQNQLVVNQRATTSSLEKLSSGLRINSAGDDAAGLAISEKMRSQIRGLEKAQLNAQDGISMIQTAEGALQEVSDIMQRMRELAVQSMNGILSQSEKDAISSELNQLSDEIDRIAETTTFNGTYLLKGTLGMNAVKEDTNAYVKDENGDYALIKGIDTLDVSGAENNTEYKFAVDGEGNVSVTYTIDGVKYTGKSTTGAITSDKFTGFMRFELDGARTNVGIKLNLNEMSLVTLGSLVIRTSVGGTTNLQIGANSVDRSLVVTMPDLRSDALGINKEKLLIDNVDVASDTLDAIDNALTRLNAVRGDLGAYQNRMEYTMDALAAGEENLTAAESRIRDVDMAAEMVNYTRSNILNQTANAMLAQANQQPQQVLQLLQGL